ncbi:hypothetical protein LTS18_007952, partial [Coniosporium uncinatum]
SPASRITELIEAFINVGQHASEKAANGVHGTSNQVNGTVESDDSEEGVIMETIEETPSGDDKPDRDDEWADRYGNEETKAGPATNGRTNALPLSQASNVAEKEAVRTDKLTQLLFDVCYLQRALSSTESALHDLAEKLRMEAAVGQAELERLRKSAAEYWKRTYLLFGLLAA